MRKEKDKKDEVEYKNKSGTAWSHSFLNQKPWHPLSYPNQRRKWIAEQTDAEHQRKSEEVSREFAQEQEFFRTSAMLSKKEREKLEVMQAVSFMYMRPPGYNAESARAAEIAAEKKVVEDDTEVNVAAIEDKAVEAKKRRVKDLYGRTIPTEEEFPVLKNAPRLESGSTARVKPFAVEIRNVKCARCGAFGHQSGDRECPLKDSITTIDEARLKRDDPLTSMMSVVSSEPLKWELKQRPGGMSPPRGGYRKDDPNQQIIAEDIFDEYGGFLAGGSEVQDLLALLPDMKHKRKEHKKKQRKEREVSDSTSQSDSGSDSERDCRRKRRKHKEKREREVSDSTGQSDRGSDSERERRRKRRKHKEKRERKVSDSTGQSDRGSDSERERRRKRRKRKEKRERERSGRDSKRSKKTKQSRRSRASSESDSRTT